MDVAFIHSDYPSAEGTGAAHSATQIVTGLSNAGYNVDVYCPKDPPWESYSDLNCYHLSGHSSHPHTITRLNNEVQERIEKFKEYDLIHSYLMELIPSVAIIGKKTTTSTVVTLNAYQGICPKNDLLYKNQEQCEQKSTLKCINCIAQTGTVGNDHGYLYRTASRLFSLRQVRTGGKRLKHIDGFQALSPHIKETYTQFGYDSSKIDIIPNILDERFYIEHKSDFSEPFDLLYVGRLEKSKGVDRIVDVFCRILRQINKEVTLTIVGEGALKSKLHQQVRNKNLTKLVDIRGLVPYNELPNVYASHDVFLYTGRWNEPFGRVFLEAMATGTPIIATDVGNVREIVGQAGVISQKDTSAIVDTAINALNNAKLESYSKAGKQKVEEYRSSSIIPRFEQLYSRVS